MSTSGKIRANIYSNELGFVYYIHASISISIQLSNRLNIISIQYFKYCIIFYISMCRVLLFGCTMIKVFTKNDTLDLYTMNIKMQAA